MSKPVRPEDMNEEEHRAWLESLSEDESLVVQTPVGYQWLMLNAAYCKRVLQEKEMSVGTRLRLLEGLNKLTDLYFTPEMLAAIQPMSDTEIRIFNEAKSLDREEDRPLCSASFNVLTSWRVFGHFRRLNPSYLAAIKLSANARESLTVVARCLIATCSMRANYVNRLFRRLRILGSTRPAIRRILGTNPGRVWGLSSAKSAKLENPMDRRELLLAVLAAARGRPFHPAQIQKAIFLICSNLPHLIQRGPRYNFVPYNYGPFDRYVYVEAERLQTEDLAVIAPSSNGRWNTYAASEAGLRRGETMLSQMDQRSRGYIEAVIQWVLAQSFGSLVKSIYDAYPEMRENSIFQG